MSTTELLQAIRALPKAEQVQLLHLLIDGVTATDDGITDEMRKLLPSPGIVVETQWPVTTDAAGSLALEEMLAEMKNTP